LEFYIAEEGKPVNIGYESTTIAYYGSEIDLYYETEPPHGDGIFSAKLPLLEMKLPFWMYGRNLVFLDAYYLLAETVKKGTSSPITSMLINIHTGKYASLDNWYNNISVEESEVVLKNDFDGSALTLKDVENLSWVSLV
jgi:hypothetical protein